MGSNCRAEGIWAGRNPYGFRYNLNHPWVRDRYLAYKRRLGLPEYVPLSDKQRRELEQQLDRCLDQR